MARIIGDIDELLTAVRHLARSDVDSIHTEVKEEVESIRREAEKKGEAERKKILSEARNRARQQTRREKAEQNREEKRTYLLEREKLLEEVWEKAESELRSLTEDKASYADALERLAVTAAVLLGPGTFHLASDDQGQKMLNRKRLKKWAGQAQDALNGPVSFEKTDESADIWGGLIITDKNDERRKVDASFAARLAYARDIVRSQVWRRLKENE